MDRSVFSSPLLQCIAISLVICALVGGGLAAVYAVGAHHARLVAEEKGRGMVESTAALLTHELADSVSDLQFLSNMQEATEVFTSLMSPELATNLLFFSQDKKIYDQIRYLDRYGMEVFRVDYHDGYPRMRRPEELQFKGGRYYFEHANVLGPDEIYLSPLDLNMENGLVELPFKPVIRLATPLFDPDGTRRGVVVLNSYGKHLLELLSPGGLAPGECQMLLNEEGYWLRGEVETQEWGFMLHGRSHNTFRLENPDGWKAMQSAPEGVYADSDGLYVYQWLDPGERLHGEVGLKVRSDAGKWLLAHFIPNTVLLAEPRAALFRMASILLPLGIVLVVGVFLLCRFRRSTRQARKDMQAQQKSYSRFVPKEFLALLGKGNYRELNLDSHASCELCVLFSDIRSYTTLSESMNHSELIAFLNDYFAVVNGPVRACGGFVDSFQGDALMALFPGRAEGAVHAAVAMHKSVEAFNRRRQAQEGNLIRAGIGVHFGEVTLGALGTNERMQATVIGDVVNLAARIESSTKVFGVNIVISDAVYKQLPNPDAFMLREIDMVRVKGKQVPVTLYEVFDADPDDVRQQKKQSSEPFARGLALYRKGDFEEAAELFARCTQMCPEDTISPIYLKRCKTMQRIPPGDGWTGISTL